MLAADQGDSSVYDQLINDDTENLIDDEFIEKATQLKEKNILKVLTKILLVCYVLELICISNSIINCLC